MPSVAFKERLQEGRLFVARRGFDNFQNDVALANDLATGLFEIDSDSISVNGLNAAQSPVRLIGMTHDGAWRQQEIHWVLCILCCWLQYRLFAEVAQFAAACCGPDIGADIAQRQNLPGRKSLIFERAK